MVMYRFSLWSSALMIPSSDIAAIDDTVEMLHRCGEDADNFPRVIAPSRVRIGGLKQLERNIVAVSHSVLRSIRASVVMLYGCQRLSTRGCGGQDRRKLSTNMRNTSECRE